MKSRFNCNLTLCLTEIQDKYMLAIFAKKKVSEDKVVQTFVHSIIDVVDTGWEDVAALIDNDPALTSDPKIRNVGSDKFLMIVIAANLKFIPKYFKGDQEDRIEHKIIEHLADVFELEENRLYKHIKDLKQFMSRVNHPSKNVLYSMSKAIYHKYHLNKHQETYFKNLNTPNPLLLKRLDELMSNFIWDWDFFFEKFKVAS